jgi:hypothetical protein
MSASTRLYLVEPAVPRARGLGDVLLGGCFRSLCVLLRKTAEVYGLADTDPTRETPAWLVGAGQIAPVVAGRWPLQD